ncbi:MAG: TonB-dependent receptor, partial [Bryobacteraceae bacterium]
HFGIISGARLNFGGNAGVLRAPGNENSLNYFGPSIPILKGNGRDKPWFDSTRCTATIATNCFGQPGNLQFGNLGPLPLAGPGSWDMSLSVFRDFKVHERLTMQLRGESFNTANTPIWGNPDTNIGNATFGYITGAGGNRTIQLGLKIVY